MLQSFYFTSQVKGVPLCVFGYYYWQSGNLRINMLDRLYWSETNQEPSDVHLNWSSVYATKLSAWNSLLTKWCWNLTRHCTLDNFNSNFRLLAFHLSGVWLVNRANKFADPLDCLITCDEFPSLSFCKVNLSGEYFALISVGCFFYPDYGRNSMFVIRMKCQSNSVKCDFCNTYRVQNYDPWQELSNPTEHFRPSLANDAYCSYCRYYLALFTSSHANHRYSVLFLFFKYVETIANIFLASSQFTFTWMSVETNKWNPTFFAA